MEYSRECPHRISTLVLEILNYGILLTGSCKYSVILGKFRHRYRQRVSLQIKQKTPIGTYRSKLQNFYGIFFQVYNLYYKKLSVFYFNLRKANTVDICIVKFGKKNISTSKR